MSWRVIIVEDELPARAWLEKLVGLDPDWKLLTSLERAGQILPACEAHLPDLLLLDISLQQEDVFDVLRTWQVEKRPHIVFITASEDHAIQAFDESAIDYVLKPFDPPRLKLALEKAKQALKTKAVAVTSPIQKAIPSYLKHINIQDAGQNMWIPVEQIDWIEGADYYVKVHVGTKWYWSRSSLKTLEKGLDPQKFMRTHKSALVQISRVEIYLEPTFGGMNLQMKNGQLVKVSRRQKKRIQALLKQSQALKE